jgi:hypothetical protein
MAIAVASTFTRGNITPTVGVITSGIQKGDLLVAVTGMWRTGISDPGPLAPVDNQANVWTLRSSNPWSIGAKVGTTVYDCIVAATGPTLVTCGSSLGDSAAAVVYRITGFDTTPQDQFNIATGLIDSRPSCPVITTTQETHLYIQAIACVGIQAAFRLPQGYVLDQDQEGADGSMFCASALGPPQTTGGFWTLNTPGSSRLHVASYYQGAIASDTPRPIAGKGATW